MSYMSRFNHITLLLYQLTGWMLWVDQVQTCCPHLQMSAWDSRAITWQTQQYLCIASSVSLIVCHATISNQAYMIAGLCMWNALPQHVTLESWRVEWWQEPHRFRRNCTGMEAKFARFPRSQGDRNRCCRTPTGREKSCGNLTERKMHSTVMLLLLCCSSTKESVSNFYQILICDNKKSNISFDNHPFTCGFPHSTEDCLLRHCCTQHSMIHRH